MSEMREQSALVDRLRRRFDDSVRNMDAGTAARVARCRENALAGGGRSLSASFWMPAGAIATACLAVVVYSQLPDRIIQEEPAAGPDAVLEQMELISNLELYEDLEFFQWLELDELPS